MLSLSIVLLVVLLVRNGLSYVDQCPLSINCFWAYPSYQTKHLACTSTQQCPQNYMCCSDCKFEHYICKKSIRANKDIPYLESFSEEHCPKDERKCRKPHPFDSTKHLACDGDSKCPNGYFCCKDSCYKHRVCKIALPEIATTVPPKKQSHSDNFCPNNTKSCSEPFPASQTKEYECNAEKACLRGHVCCSDSCYGHKICKKSLDEDSLCPKDIGICQEPIPYNETKKYECDQYSQFCMTGYVCCKDSCYQHNICKVPSNNTEEIKPPLENIDLTCPPNIRKELCPKTTYQNGDHCSNDTDCFSGYKCCQDTCLGESVCKVPANAFVLPHTPKEYTEEQNPVCPSINKRCDRPYSLRIAKHLKCSGDEDCFKDEACCRDECITYFKICKKVQDRNVKTTEGVYLDKEAEVRPPDEALEGEISNGVGSEGIGSEGIGSEGIGSEDIGSEGIGSEDIGSEGIGSEDVGSEGIGSEHIGSVGIVPDDSTIEVFNPEDFSEEIVNQEGFSQESVNPEDFNRESFNQESFNQDNSNSEGSNQENSNPKSSNQENSNPKSSNPENFTPERLNQKSPNTQSLSPEYVNSQSNLPTSDLATEFEKKTNHKPETQNVHKKGEDAVSVRTVVTESLTNIAKFPVNIRCPKFERGCEEPHLGLVGSILCYEDGDCKSSEVCCPDECFQYISVCKNRTVLPEENCPTTEETCAAPFNSVIGKIICGEDVHCAYHEVCCSDPCLPSLKVCKRSRLMPDGKVGSNITIGSNVSGTNVIGTNVIGTNTIGTNTNGSNVIGSNITGSIVSGSGVTGPNVNGPIITESNGIVEHNSVKNPNNTEESLEVEDLEFPDDSHHFENQESIITTESQTANMDEEISHTGSQETNMATEMTVYDEVTLSEGNKINQLVVNSSEKDRFGEVVTLNSVFAEINNHTSSDIRYPTDMESTLQQHVESNTESNSKEGTEEGDNTQSLISEGGKKESEQTYSEQTNSELEKNKPDDNEFVKETQVKKKDDDSISLESNGTESSRILIVSDEDYDVSGESESGEIDVIIHADVDAENDSREDIDIDKYIEGSGLGEKESENTEHYDIENDDIDNDDIENDDAEIESSGYDEIGSGHGEDDTDDLETSDEYQRSDDQNDFFTTITSYVFSSMTKTPLEEIGEVKEQDSLIDTSNSTLEEKTPKEYGKTEHGEEIGNENEEVGSEREEIGSESEEIGGESEDIVTKEKDFTTASLNTTEPSLADLQFTEKNSR